MIEAGTARIMTLGSGLAFKVPEPWRGDYQVEHGAQVHCRRTLAGALRYELAPTEYTRALRVRRWRAQAVVSVVKADAEALALKAGDVLELRVANDGTLEAIPTKD